MATGIDRIFYEPFAAISHWVGAGLAVVGTVALLWQADGRPVHVAAALIYGLSLIALFTASGLAHTAHSPKWIERLYRVDFAAIFFLIAGSYTPICLLALKGTWGWGILLTEWLLAGLGVFSVTRPNHFPRGMRVILYIIMGWLGLLVGGPVVTALPGPILALLVAGGVIYTVGAVVFFTDRPHLWPGRFMAHDLWHCMVLAAAGCHFAVNLQLVGG